jgi:hypothetical protein
MMTLARLSKRKFEESLVDDPGPISAFQSSLAGEVDLFQTSKEWPGNQRGNHDQRQ